MVQVVIRLQIKGSIDVLIIIILIIIIIFIVLVDEPDKNLMQEKPL
jgi:hypothetical protein